MDGLTWAGSGSPKVLTHNDDSSSWASYILSEFELHRLDVQICKKLRAWEGGAQVAHDTHVKVLTNKQLMRRWGGVPATAALAMQLIRRLQDMVRHPLAHQQ
eukprot:3344485-Pyramimonas_sp.AAC.1